MDNVGNVVLARPIADLTCGNGCEFEKRLTERQNPIFRGMPLVGRPLFHEHNELLRMRYVLVSAPYEQ